MNDFFNNLNYSSVNEDSNSEIRALNIKEDDKIFCISGSGTRSLDLLTQLPSQIVSVDYNPCQNFLLELKMAAIKVLEYEDCLRFLGVSHSERRDQIYLNIRPFISSDALYYWDKNSEIIKQGVVYKGRWEQYFKLLSLFLNLTRKYLSQKLFSCSSVLEQNKLWNNHWDNYYWQTFLRLVSSRIGWKYFLRDPGFYKYVPEEFSIYEYLNKRFNSASENFLFNQSPFATLLLKGKLDASKSLPPHLQKQNFAKLKESLSRIKIVTASLINYLKDSKNEKFNAFSLSDISSYAGLKDYKKMWTTIFESSLEGALICERQFLVKREIPQIIAKKFERDQVLENELAKTDNSIFYTFIVAEKVRG